jgi:hypothetical protein
MNNHPKFGRRFVGHLCIVGLEGLNGSSFWIWKESVVAHFKILPGHSIGEIEINPIWARFEQRNLHSEYKQAMEH